jgi:hypothetical protein
MNNVMSRRSVLAGAGLALAGTTMAQLLSVARAQEAAQAQADPQICLSMLFESGQKSRFDTDKYIKRHLPLLREVYGETVERIELRTASSTDLGIPSALLASTTFWIRDVAGFGQKLTANAARINEDLDNVAKCNRIVQPDRIVSVLGEERGRIPLDAHVFSFYYRDPTGSGAAFARQPAASAPAADFDQRHFTESFLPQVFSLYGSNVIQRLEGMVGLDQSGRKATQVASYHAYIRDRTAYDQKSGSVFSQVAKDGGQYMQAFSPIMADLRLKAFV